MKPTFEQNWTATVGNLPLTDCVVKVQGGGAPTSGLRDHMCSNVGAILCGNLSLNSVWGLGEGIPKGGQVVRLRPGRLYPANTGVM